MSRPLDLTALGADDSNAPSLPRRGFLRSTGVLLGAGAATAGDAFAQTAPPAAATASGARPVPPSMKVLGEPAGGKLYGLPSSFEGGVIRNVTKGPPQPIATATRTPLQELDGIITPNGLFYERHHAGVPAIDPAQHRLMLHGMVDNHMIDATVYTENAPPLMQTINDLAEQARPEGLVYQHPRQAVAPIVPGAKVGS